MISLVYDFFNLVHFYNNPQTTQERQIALARIPMYNYVSPLELLLGFINLAVR